MNTVTCAVYIFDGFAEQEVASLASGRIQIETFSASGKVVRGMGGLRIVPDYALSEADPDDFDILLLPHGHLWERGDNFDVFPLVMAAFGKKPIVASGAGTLALADLGLLNDLPHTSCHPGYIDRYCQDYAGSIYYRSASCVDAGAVITLAGGQIEALAMAVISQTQTSREWTQSFFEQ